MLRFLLFLAFTASCTSNKFQEDREFLGKTVTAETLNYGHDVYVEYCLACHGADGNGYGPAAKGSQPPPRNLKQGLYKFGLVKDMGLPTDADFHRIIKKGLNGTAMLPWDMSDQQINAVTQYIKTFAPQVWQDSESYSQGEQLEKTADPFGQERKQEAIAIGKKAYYIKANCQSCHRGYVSYPEYNQILAADGQDPLQLGDIDPGFYDVKPQMSEYVHPFNENLFIKYVAPDFTWHPLRSVHKKGDIKARLDAGVTGAAMPAWKDILTEEELWGLEYYIRDLMELKGSSERENFMDQIQSQNKEWMEAQEGRES